MITQNKPGIYVYQSNDGKKFHFTRYETIWHFIGHNLHHNWLKVYSDNLSKKFVITNPTCWDPVYPKYVFDENGNIFTLDRLVGYERQYLEDRRAHYDKQWALKPRRKSCYGGYRKIHTFQERRMSLDIDKEYGVKCRSARNWHNLYSSWDDIRSYVSRSWKDQNKRKHQWIEND
jgi:hypothetical protein